MEEKREKCDLGAKMNKIVCECHSPCYSYSKALRGEVVERVILLQSDEVSRHLKSHFYGVTVSAFYVRHKGDLDE